MLCHTVRVGYSRGLKERQGEAAQGMTGEHPLPRPAQFFSNVAIQPPDKRKNLGNERLNSRKER